MPIYYDPQNSSRPKYGWNSGSFDDLSPLTTNGDLIVYSGSTSIRLPVGADTEVLTADATAPGGIKWAAGGGPGGSTPVTGAGNFFVTSLLKVSGTLSNPVGHLVLSSSVGSRVTVSGNFRILGNNTGSLVDVGLATTGNQESTPVTVGYAIKLETPPTAFATETTAIYVRPKQNSGSDTFNYGIYGEIDDEQTQVGGGITKVIHKGRGDAHYVALMCSGAGFGYEGAMFKNGENAFIATWQGALGFAESELNQANSVGFQALVADDGVDPQFVPNYGLFFANNSPGHAVTIRQSRFANRGQVQFRITDDGYRGLFHVFGNGETHLIGITASVTAGFDQASPPLSLRANFWHAGSGSSFPVQTSFLTTLTGSGPHPKLYIRQGQPGSETLCLIVTTASLDMQGHDVISVDRLTMKTSGRGIDAQGTYIMGLAAITGSATSGLNVDFQSGELVNLNLLRLKTNGSGADFQGTKITNIQTISGSSANGMFADFQGGHLTSLGFLKMQTNGSGADFQGTKIMGLATLTASAAGLRMFFQAGDIRELSAVTGSATGMFVNFQGGAISSISALTASAGGLHANWQGGSLASISAITGSATGLRVDWQGGRATSLGAIHHNTSVAISSSLEFPELTKNYHINAINGRLILSSSATSIIAVSGVINIEPPTAGRGVRLSTNNGFGATGLFISSEAGARNANLFLDGLTAYANGGGSLEMAVGRGGIGGGTSFGTGITMSTAHIIKWSGGTLLAGAADAVLQIGRNDSGSLYISGALGRNEIMAKTSHLILSSAQGTIAISGALKFGDHSAVAAETITGYVTIVDNTGTTRKLAVIS
jgi:hypothetical protein